MKKHKNWIQSAIKHPGALHRQLKVPAGKKIPAGKLATAANKKGVLGRRARLAETLKGLKHKKSPRTKHKFMDSWNQAMTPARNAIRSGVINPFTKLVDKIPKQASFSAGYNKVMTPVRNDIKSIPGKLRDAAMGALGASKVPALNEETVRRNGYTASKQTSPYQAQTITKIKQKKSAKVKHKFSLGGMFRPSANPRIPNAAVKIAPAGSLFNQHAQQLKEAMAYKKTAAMKCKSCGSMKHKTHPAKKPIFKVNNKTKDFGNVNLDTKVITINKKRHKTAGKGELMDTMVHEMMHLKKPEASEMKIKKATTKKIKTMSRKSKSRLMSKLK